ncbi:Uncharacterised protein [Mycobacteroides abscessus subsp. abscessus]|nr:Uncharacterised protein [Mycobacteroides abscessus subsp. abscessus]
MRPAGSAVRSAVSAAASGCSTAPSTASASAVFSSSCSGAGALSAGLIGSRLSLRPRRNGAERTG